ncbi:Jumonji/ARID domain-containing protein 2 [Yarrowia sp. B02]|nr:Jumonji/ARID domain-containing protein 2 [Yarrowia sp. B02]
MLEPQVSTGDSKPEAAGEPKTEAASDAKSDRSASSSTSPTSSVPQKRPTEETAHTPVKAPRVDKSPSMRNGHQPHAPPPHFVYNDHQQMQQPVQGQPQQPHNPFLYPQSRSRANPPLDMGTVDSRATTRQLFENDSSIRNDRFKLEHIPTVYPTMEDFQNRPKYMEMLHKYYGKYGMVKIVPPERWNIPFRLDTEMFWFKTRRQDLNSSLQGRSAEQCFVSDLFQFHIKHKTPIVKLPSIDKRPIDVYHLFHCVHLRGGFVEVCRRKLWAQVGRELGYSGKIMTSLSTSLKSSYQKILHPFDQYLESSQGPKKYRPVMPLANYQLSSDTAVRAEEAAKSASAIDQRNSPVVGSNLLLLREGKYQPFEASMSVALDDEIDDFAVQSAKVPHKVGYSGIQLTPADSKNAASYNLRQFQQKCDRFDESFLGTRKKPVGQEGENFVENEYWEALGNSELAVEVEYGSNIHSAIHGSTNAMPEQNSLRNVNDQWNLNIAPHMRDGMFQYVDDSAALQISMPWLHVGMMFSTQSWGVEDMNMWSLDYMHFGSTRTWYSVSPAHYEKFQKLLERYIEKGERKIDSKFVLEPDLMISPQILRDEGIDVYICDQRPGEYVLSFPQAYRSHFCHGFNMSESVNLCPISWLDGPAQEAASLYAKHAQLPAFSYERLLLNIARRGRLCERQTTAPRFIEVLERELEARKAVREGGIPEEKVEDEDQLVFCDSTLQPLVFSYVSVLSGDDDGPWETTYALAEGKKVTSKKTLKLIVSDKELDRMYETAKTIAKMEDYGEKSWKRRLEETMDSATPNLHHCRELLFDGQNVNPKMTELYYLHQFVATCEHWVTRARAFLEQGKRSYDRKDREGPVDKEPEVPQVTREEISLLVEGFNQMPFDCLEVDDFFDCLRYLEQLASDVQYALHDPSCTYTPIEYIRLVHEVRHASVAIPYADQLYQLSTKLRWCEKALGLIDRACADTIQSTLREGDLMGFNMSEVAYRELMGHLQHVINQGPNYVPPLRLKEKNVNLVKIEEEPTGTPEQEDVVMEDVETRSTSPSSGTADTEDTHTEMQLVAHIEPPEVSIPASFVSDPLPAAKIIPQPASLLPSGKPVDTAAAFEESTELETAGDGSLSIEYSEMCIQLGSESVDKRPSLKTAADLLALAEAEDDVSLPTLQACMKTNEEWLKRGKQTFYRRSGANRTMMTRLKAIYKSLNLCFSEEDTYDRDVKALAAEEKGESLEASEAKLFCFCRQRESGVMVGCDKCAEWYHSKCLKNAGVKTRSQEEFICHICDNHVPTQWKDYKPSLEEIEEVFKQSHSLPLQCPEVILLQHVIQKAGEVKEKLEIQVIRGKDPKTSDLSAEEARYYLRRLEGVDLVIPSLVDFFRQLVWLKDPVGSKPPIPALEMLKQSKVQGKKKEKKEVKKEVKEETKEKEVKEVREENEG